MSFPKILTLVLGVHRSGTSLLTQGLRAAGAGIGEFDDIRDPDNPEGYAELPAVRQFNDRLLAHLGASWDNWGFRSGTVDWDSAGFASWFDAAVKVLQTAFPGQGPFVLKDPRCATLAPFWERVVPRAGFVLRRIIIVRDPAEVAESQRQRALRRPQELHVIAEAEPMAALWAVTMTECLHALSGDATLLVGHHGLLTAPHVTLAAAADFAGLTPGDGAIAAFVAQGVKPALYRARPASGVPTGNVGAWMQAARALFGDLTAAPLPRLLTVAEARAIAAAQSRIADLRPGLSAVQASIARMQTVSEGRRSQVDGLNALVWSLAPFGSRATPASLADAIDRAINFANSSDIVQTSFPFAHTVGRLLLFAGRRTDAVQWLDRVRPHFGLYAAFQQLEAKILDLKDDSSADT